MVKQGVQDWHKQPVSPGPDELDPERLKTGTRSLSDFIKIHCKLLIILNLS